MPRRSARAAPTPRRSASSARRDAASGGDDTARTARLHALRQRQRLSAGVARRRRGDHAAGDARARVAGRLRRVVVRADVNDERLAGELGRPAGEAAHPDCRSSRCRRRRPCSAGRSPAWCSPLGGPCGLPFGLKWPPALIASPLEQSPFSWTWKPCSWLAFRPVTRPRMRTSPPSAMNQTVPAAVLPVVGCSVVATYDGGGGDVAQPRPSSDSEKGQGGGVKFHARSPVGQADR